MCVQLCDTGKQRLHDIHITKVRGSQTLHECRSALVTPAYIYGFWFALILCFLPCGLQAPTSDMKIAALQRLVNKLPQLNKVRSLEYIYMNICICYKLYMYIYIHTHTNIMIQQIFYKVLRYHTKTLQRSIKLLLRFVL